MTIASAKKTENTSSFFSKNIKFRQTVLLLLLWFLLAKIFFWGLGVLLSIVYKDQTALFFVEEVIIYRRFIETMVTLYLFVRWFNKTWQISPQKIIANQGFLYRKQFIVAIKNIESITVNQNIIQKIFRVGTIILSAPTLKKNIKLRHVSQPMKKSEKIEYLLPKTDEEDRHSSDSFILG